MALVLNQKLATTLPIEVNGITPDQLIGQSITAIKQRVIGLGNQDVSLGDIFDVSGSLQQTPHDEPTIHWTGKLISVHWLGAQMKSGRMLVESSIGRHAGSQMSGGTIEVLGDASDYTGAEMTGGTIRVTGNAGDLTGANYPGSKTGMNRGQIFISGNAGRGTGQRMRRGTIVVGADCSDLVGWEMRAGTIVVLGRCGANAGLSMSRGTIVLTNPEQPKSLVPITFTRGSTCEVPVFRLMSNWLKQVAPTFDFSKLSATRFTQFHGDTLTGNRGEIFVAAND